MESEQPSKREIQRRPYTRLTEAMAEVALEINHLEVALSWARRQYMWLEREFAQTQVYRANIVYNPVEDVDLAPDQPVD